MITTYRVSAPAPAATTEVVRTVGRATTWATTLAGPALSCEPDVLVVEIPTPVAVRGFTSSWGLEFEPTELAPAEETVWQVTSGRSSNGALPWLQLDVGDEVVVITVHWSGNWRFVISPGDGLVRITVGLQPDGQRPSIAAGERQRLPEISIATGRSAFDAARALVELLSGRTGPSPAGLPTEWNHWWPYEDAEINEAVFLAEAEVAADLGIEVAVLDAGWFGRDDPDSDWVAERGDWHLVNSARFPHGLAWLADQTRSRGIDFGVWIEAEAIGPGATINVEHPELLARTSSGDTLGYVCLGSPAGRAHVLRRVEELIETTDARWVKWDFNLDPGSGCARDDHGHRADDGLLRHYLGLYAVMDALRADHPDTVLEACSSGGLRIDAGLAAHVDAFFLSDPDWTEHHLACLWGAAQLLPPRQLLHWPQSEWRGEHRFQKVDYSGTLITASQFDTKIRAAMLHRFGLSVRLTELRPDLRERLRDHLRSYEAHIRPLLADGVLMPLTAQPRREEKGHRQPAFQLSSGDRHVVAAFRLPPQEWWDPVLPAGLDPAAGYQVARLDGSGAVEQLSGAELVSAGLRVADPGATSMLWTVRRYG